MAVFLGVVLTVATGVGSAYLGHRFQLAHMHVLGILPIGALMIGAAASVGVILAVRIASGFDTPGVRLLGQIAGVSAYCGAVVFDYGAPIAVARGAVSRLGFGEYLAALIDQEAKDLVAVLPSFLQIPPGVSEWFGVVQLILEAVVAAVATGWMISFFADVPYCFTNHRFYNLKTIMESRDLNGLREWERAIDEYRPIEARSIFTRVRTVGVGDSREWMRVAVHQFPVCLKSRVRIEPRHRTLGITYTELGRDLNLDSRGSAAIPD
jgi:hypothetical protein